MQLGFGQMGHKRFDQNRRLALSNEWRCGCHDGFGTGNFHRPKEKNSEFSDEPLQYAPIVQKLDESDEKYHRWKNPHKKVTGRYDDVGCQE